MKAFIIRLRENALSCDVAEECVAQAKKFGTEVEYFDAIYGNAGLDVFKEHGVGQFQRKVKEITPGIVGCAASHYLLWKKCFELDETLLILEQDGYQIRPLPADIEDNFTDIIKLDNCRPSLAGYERCVRQDHEIKYMDYKWPDWIVNNLQPKKIRRIPYGYPYFNGAWSYMIKPAGASKVCRAFETQGWVPADKALGSDIMSLKTTQETIFRLHPRYTPKKIKDLSLTRNL